MTPSDPIARALVNALAEPALLIGGRTVQLANPAAQRLLGKGIEGRDVRLAIRHPQALDRILGHMSGVVDVTGIAEPGRSWRLAIEPLDGGHVLVRMTDRSQSVSAERMRVDFVANASHELRTPLSAVIGYAETLADEAGLAPSTIASFGGTIRDEARRMLRIVEDLMSLSRIEADRFVAPADSVAIADVVAEAVANAGHARGRSKCEVDAAIADDLPPVRGDRAQLVQMLDNLIGNAIRYGCDRPDARIEVAARRDRQWLRLSVTDHGPGIARHHLPRVTERFYRVDEARSRESGGTGLGLSIVKHIVERHRGTLDIASTPGAGTTVTVALPVAA